MIIVLRERRWKTEGDTHARRKPGLGEGKWGGDHQSFLASSLKATSLSLPGMISLGDPTTREHNTIWSSRGSLLEMEKNLAAGDGVVSLICSKPSETKTTRANILAARASSRPSSTLTACLVSSGFSLNLSSTLTTSLFPLSFATPMASVMLTSPGFPRSISLPDAIHHLMTSRWPQQAARQSGVNPLLLGSFTSTLVCILQHLTNTGGVSKASQIKGRVSIFGLQIDVDIRMGQE